MKISIEIRAKSLFVVVVVVVVVVVKTLITNHMLA